MKLVAVTVNVMRGFIRFFGPVILIAIIVPPLTGQIVTFAGLLIPLVILRMIWSLYDAIR